MFHSFLNQNRSKFAFKWSIGTQFSLNLNSGIHTKNIQSVDIIFALVRDQTKCQYSKAHSSSGLRFLVHLIMSTKKVFMGVFYLDYIRSFITFSKIVCLFVFWLNVVSNKILIAIQNGLERKMIHNDYVNVCVSNFFFCWTHIK